MLRVESRKAAIAKPGSKSSCSEWPRALGLIFSVLRFFHNGWMRLLCQNIATRANREDREMGKYVGLLDWTARQLAEGKSGSTPGNAPPIFARLSIEPKAWCKLVGNFGRLFCSVAGLPQTIDVTRSRIGQHRYYVPKQTRDLLPAI